MTRAQAPVKAPVEDIVQPPVEDIVQDAHASINRLSSVVKQNKEHERGTVWTTRTITCVVIVVLAIHTVDPFVKGIPRFQGQKKLHDDVCAHYYKHSLTKEIEKHDCPTLSIIFITGWDPISLAVSFLFEILDNMYLSFTGAIELSWSKVWSVAQGAMAVIAITEGFNRMVALLPAALRPSWV